MFKEIFTNAVRLNGIVNMLAPEFIIDVVFINENALALHKHFFEMSNDLLKALKNRKNSL